jgi:hypothetical protein
MSQRPSQRESAIGALFAVLGQLSLGTTVKRNAALPERVADHAMAILRDGEMGEPEVSLSPLTYHWQHQVAIELFVADPDASARDARMDGLAHRVRIPDRNRPHAWRCHRVRRHRSTQVRRTGARRQQRHQGLPAARGPALQQQLAL